MGVGRRRLAAVLTAALASVALGAFGASSALAANGKIYVSLPTGLGNCPKGGAVVGVWGTTGPYGELWSTPATGDWGDDIVYATVRIGTTNTFTFKGFCKRPWYKGGSYWGPESQNTRRVSRVNQTVWVGPYGTWAN